MQCVNLTTENEENPVSYLYVNVEQWEEGNRK